MAGSSLRRGEVCFRIGENWPRLKAAEASQWQERDSRTRKRLTQQGFRESSQEGIKRSEELSLEGGLNKTTKQDGADIDTFRSGGRRLKVISTYSVKVEAEQET